MTLKSLAMSTDEMFDTVVEHLNKLSQSFDNETDDKFADTIVDLERVRNKRWVELRELIISSPAVTDDMTTPAFLLKHDINGCLDDFLLKDKKAPLFIKFEREYRDGVEHVVVALQELITQTEALNLAITNELTQEYEAIVAKHLDELVHEAIIDARAYVNEYMADGTGEIELLTQEGVPTQDALNLVKLGWNNIFPSYTISVPSDSERLNALLDEHRDIVVGEIKHMFSLPVMQSVDEHVMNTASEKYFKNRPNVDDSILYLVLYPMVSRAVLDTMKI